MRYQSKVKAFWDKKTGINKLQCCLDFYTPSSNNTGMFNIFSRVKLLIGHIYKT